jgi:hypothetical protein
MTLRRRVVKCESCHQQVVVEYPDNLPEKSIKHALGHAHRLRYSWCKANRPKLLWVSDEEVKE